jgi:hypothetical protein
LPGASGPNSPRSVLGKPTVSPWIQAGIPNRAHLIWFGSSFPWVNVLAVKSAALRGRFDEVILHHDSNLEATPHYRELVRTPNVVLRKLNVPALLASCTPHGEVLTQIFDRLEEPATRADLVRLAILYEEGGVYLDMDTITLADFGSLLSVGSAFLGEEQIVYPAHVRASRNPLVRGAAHARSVLRSALRELQDGWHLFRRFQHLYPRAANNAILGCKPRCDFICQTLSELCAIPVERHAIRFVIGPQLLQRMVQIYPFADLTIYRPEVFYPFGPEISEHWFRLRPRIALDEVLSPNTRLVHWYGSVRTKKIAPQIDPAYVRSHASQQFFSALALPFVD